MCVCVHMYIYIYMYVYVSIYQYIYIIRVVRMQFSACACACARARLCVCYVQLLHLAVANIHTSTLWSAHWWGLLTSQQTYIQVGLTSVHFNLTYACSKVKKAGTLKNGVVVLVKSMLTQFPEPFRESPGIHKGIARMGWEILTKGIKRHHGNIITLINLTWTDTMHGANLAQESYCHTLTTQETAPALSREGTGSPGLRLKSAVGVGAYDMVTKGANHESSQSWNQHQTLTRLHHFDRRNPRPTGGFFYLLLFANQEPGGRGPPSKYLVQIPSRGSSFSGFLIREHSR